MRGFWAAVVSRTFPWVALAAAPLGRAWAAAEVERWYWETWNEANIEELKAKGAITALEAPTHVAWSRGRLRSASRSRDRRSRCSCSSGANPPRLDAAAPSP